MELMFLASLWVLLLKHVIANGLPVLGTATLPEGVNTENQYSKAVDIFAFGLCVLELSIKRKVDSSNAASWPEMLEYVEDEEAKAFLLRCAHILVEKSQSF